MSSNQSQWCRRTAMQFGELLKNKEEKHQKELEEKEHELNRMKERWENELAHMEERWDEEVRSIHRDYLLEKEENKRLMDENTTLKKNVEDLIKLTANIPLP